MLPFGVVTFTLNVPLLFVSAQVPAAGGVPAVKVALLFMTT